MRARVCLGFRVSTAVGPGPHWDKHWKREVASGVRGFALDRMDRGNDSASCCNPLASLTKKLTSKTFSQLRITFNAAISACGTGLESELAVVRPACC